MLSSSWWLWKWFRFWLPWRKVSVSFGKKRWFCVRAGHLVSPTEEHLLVFLFSYLTYELVQVFSEVESYKTHFIKKDEWEHHKFYSWSKVIQVLLLTNMEEKVFCRLLFKSMLLYCFRQFWHKINFATN